MKKILILFLLISSYCFSQNYYFNNRKESLKYTDSRGQTQYKLTSNENGNYKFYFELSADGRGTKIFTVYKNGSEAYWVAETKSLGYKEIGGVIFKQAIYYNPSAKYSMYVFISEDFRKIIIMTDEDLTEYY